MKQIKRFMGFLMVLGLCMGMVYGTQQGQQVEKVSQTEAVSKLININTASAKELEALPRIGEKISERILQYRKENGPFKRKQDIIKVKGIGEKIFAQIEKMISI